MRYVFDSLFFKDYEIGVLYLGDSIVWANDPVAQSERSYDQSKIVAIALDSNGKDTDEYEYFDALDYELKNFFSANPSKNYHVIFEAGFSVTSIPPSMFYEITNIKKVTFKNSLYTINQSSFEGCTGLVSVTLPNSLTSMSSRAFANTGLSTIVIPGSLQVIYPYCFYGCRQLTTATIKEGTQTIAPSVFQNCELLHYVSLPNSLTAIYDNAFGSCTSLTDIMIPSGVQSISGEAFLNSSNLTNITINKPENSIEGAPWGATNATIVWTG